MEQFIAFVEDYGYLAVFVGSILEGESVVLIGGLLSHEQFLMFPFVVVCAFLGALVSDWGFFFLGRKRPEYISKHVGFLTKYAKVPSIFIENNPRCASFFMRFLYGFRHVVPYSIGSSCIATKQFLLWNSLGAFAWALTMTTAGYFAGNLLSSLMLYVKDHETRFVIVVVGAVLFYLALAKVSSVVIQRQKKAEAHLPHTDGDC